jgi:ribosome-associated protein YbcJ (S4-like RNA binding protein)
MKAQILKSMIVDGRKLVAGDIVEVEGWRYIKSLSTNRYIKLIEDDVVEEKKQAEKPKATKKTKEVAE